MYRSRFLTLLFAGFVLMAQQVAGGEPSVRLDRYGDPLPKGVRFRLGTVRFQHEGAVRDLAWMPDGKTLASAAYDGTVRLWRIADCKEIRRVNLGQGAIFGLAVTLDGRLLAWGAPGIGIHISDPATGKEVCLLKEVPKLSRSGSLDFSPDGKTLAVSNITRGGSHIHLYAVDSGKKLLEIDGSKNHYGAAVFSPDGKTIVVDGDDGVFCLNAATGAEVRKLTTEGVPVFTPVFSRDGKKLATADARGKGIVWVWSWPEAKLLHRLRCADAPFNSAIAFSPDGKTLATTGDPRGGLCLWDVASGKKRDQLPAHEDPITAIAFSPDGSLLAAVGDSRRISLWDMRTAKKPHLLTPRNRSFTAVASTPDGKGLVTSERDGSLVLWDARDGKEIRRLQSWQHAATCLVISADGKWLAACNARGSLGLWDLPTGRLRPALASGSAMIGCVAFSPDGEAMALGDENGVVRLCATKTGEVMRKVLPVLPKDDLLLLHPGVRALAWSADGRTLAVSYQGGGLILYDPGTSAKRRELKEPKQEVAALAFSADGRLLAAAGMESIIYVYETATAEEVRRTSGMRPWMLSVAFAPDGRTLAFAGGTTIRLHWYNGYQSRSTTGTADFAIRLWDIDEGKELRRLAGHEQQVESLAFSPDGDRLVSQGADSVVLSWDVAALMRRPTERGKTLSATRRAELWNDLANRDAVRGQKAVGQLIRYPDAAVSLLADKLKPARPLERIRTLLADLDSDEFTRREKATHELRHLGEDAAPALRNALKNKPSLEARKRMEALLETIDGSVITPEWLRTVRALQALESIGTPEAKKILERLAGGAAEARLTEEAKAGLRRLSRRTIHPQ